MDEQTQSTILRIADEGGLTVAPDWAGVASLNRKLHAAMAELGELGRDKANTHFNYRYTSYDEAADAIRVAMVKAKLAFTVYQGDIVPGSKDGYTRLGLHATFCDTETGAMRTVRWWGEAQDSGDKGIAKALTNGIKFGLMRQFLATADDEPTGQGQGQAVRRPAPRPPSNIDVKSGEIKDGTTPAAPTQATAATPAEQPPATPGTPPTMRPAPIPALSDTATRGQKLTWITAAYQHLHWAPARQIAHLSKHYQVGAVSGLQNGHVDEEIAFLTAAMQQQAEGASNA